MVVSPNIILSSIKHPKYFALECCLICISPPYLKFFKNFPVVFRSKKFILIILIIHKLITYNRRIFKNCFTVSGISLCGETRYQSSSQRKTWKLTGCDMSLTYIKNKISTIESFRVHHRIWWQIYQCLRASFFSRFKLIKDMFLFALLSYLS